MLGQCAPLLNTVMTASKRIACNSKPSETAGMHSCTCAHDLHLHCRRLVRCAVACHCQTDPTTCRARCSCMPHYIAVLPHVCQQEPVARPNFFSRKANKGDNTTSSHTAAQPATSANTATSQDRLAAQKDAAAPAAPTTAGNTSTPAAAGHTSIIDTAPGNAEDGGTASPQQVGAAATNFTGCAAC